MQPQSADDAVRRGPQPEVWLDAEKQGARLDIGDGQTLNLNVDLKQNTLAVELANQGGTGKPIKYFLPVPGDLKTVAAHTKKVDEDDQLEVAVCCTFAPPLWAPPYLQGHRLLM
eukprot:scaffold196498_cov13-Prasinocladus_malaysianus.AAC.1